MDKKEEFKNFIGGHPELVNYVKNKEMTWQDFYEIYDIYGDDANTWDKYFKQDRGVSEKVTELTSLFKNINFDNIEHYINNAQKAIGIIQELTKKTPDTTPIVEATDISFYND